MDLKFILRFSFLFLLLLLILSVIVIGEKDLMSPITSEIDPWFRINGVKLLGNSTINGTIFADGFCYLNGTCLNGSTGGFISNETDPIWTAEKIGYLKLNQSTPQTVIEGFPTFNEGLISNNTIDITGNLVMHNRSSTTGIIYQYIDGHDAYRIRSGNSDYSQFSIGMNTALGYNYIQSVKSGTGALLPLTIWIGANREWTIDTSGNLLSGSDGTTVNAITTAGTGSFGNTNTFVAGDAGPSMASFLATGSGIIDYGDLSLRDNEATIWFGDTPGIGTVPYWQIKHDLPNLVIKSNDPDATTIYLGDNLFINESTGSLTTTGNINATQIYEVGSRVCTATNGVCSGDNISWNETKAGNLFVNNSGDNMTGPLYLSEHPIQVLQAATKGYVDNITLSTTYYPTSYFEAEGTLSGGNNIGNLSYYDGQTFNITEGNGANSILFYVNFTGVTDFNNLLIREYYSGSPTHFINIEIYDYSSVSWESYTSITGQSGQTVISIPVLDPSEHINGGIVQLRFNHLQNGVSSHKLVIDYVQLIDGFSAITNIQHDGLNGRDNDTTNHPWAMPKNSSNNLITTGNITTNYIYGNGSQLKDVVIMNNPNVTANMNFTGHNITDTDCIVFKNGGIICSE